jgi:hypothetical protein
MKRSRKEARDKLQSIRTVEELKDYLDTLVLTDDQKQVALYALVKGWSRQQISMETGYSIRQVGKMLEKVYDRMM